MYVNSILNFNCTSRNSEIYNTLYISNSSETRTKLNWYFKKLYIPSNQHQAIIASL